VELQGADRMIDAIAINRQQRTVLYNDGTCAQMQHFVDRFGDETDDVKEAISAIAPLPDGRWAVIDLTKFEAVSRH
jgi:hypothetical protein